MFNEQLGLNVTSSVIVRFLTGQPGLFFKDLKKQTSHSFYILEFEVLKIYKYIFVFLY